MKKVYQFIRKSKLKIPANIFNYSSVTKPGFPIFLALIMLLVIAFLVALEYGRATTTTMTPIELFQSTDDSFRVGVPRGWVIHEMNNTGYISIQESTQGYGILAQLCPEEKEQQQLAVVSNSTTFGSSCQQQSQGEIIHIIRFPNLGAKLGIAINDIRDTIPDSIFEYEIQKLQEVGYRDINIVNSTDTTMHTYYLGLGVRTTVPARFVEMTYSTISAPNEIRRGYLFLTATNETPPNLETITGYSLFYEGASAAITATAEGTTQSESSPPSSAGELIFGSFSPIASQEAQTFVASIAPLQSKPASQQLDTIEVMMIIVYSLLVIGVLWKFIMHMRESCSSRLDEIS